MLLINLRNTKAIGDQKMDSDVNPQELETV